MYVAAVLLFQFAVINSYGQQQVTITGQFNGTKEIKAFLKKDYESIPSSNISDGRFEINMPVKSHRIMSLRLGI